MHKLLLIILVSIIISGNLSGMQKLLQAQTDLLNQINSNIHKIYPETRHNEKLELWMNIYLQTSPLQEVNNKLTDELKSYKSEEKKLQIKNKRWEFYTNFCGFGSILGLSNILSKSYNTANLNPKNYVLFSSLVLAVPYILSFAVNPYTLVRELNFDHDTLTTDENYLKNKISLISQTKELCTKFYILRSISQTILNKQIRYFKI